MYQKQSADQLHSNHATDLPLYFLHMFMQKVDFFMTWLICFNEEMTKLSFRHYQIHTLSVLLYITLFALIVLVQSTSFNLGMTLSITAVALAALSLNVFRTFSTLTCQKSERYEIQTKAPSKSMQ